MAKPEDVTELGLELYAAVAPLTYGDADANGWPLLRYSDALVQGGQQAATYGRDSGSLPGWAILANPATSPEEALDWLSQFAGVNLETLRKAMVVRQRNMLQQPQFSHLAVNAVPAKWTNTGKAATTFKVTEGWAAGRKTLEMVTASMASGEATSARSNGTTTFGPTGNLTLVKEGEHYSFRCAINVNAIVGSMLFKTRVEWYDNNGILLSTQELATTFTTTGEHLLSGTLTAPAKAAGALVYPVTAEATAAASKATLLIDKADMAPSPGNTVLEYGDGDIEGWGWTGTVGESESKLQTLQTDEEYVASRRNRIKELPAQNRGTAQSIVAAAQQYLTGNKTVYLIEQDGGAYKLTVLTLEQETPSASQVKAAIEEQLPGGIILNYQSIPTTSWAEIKGEYASWKAIKEKFLTWGGVRANKLGS